MKFVESQVVERVKNPLNSGEVIKGRKYESRLRLLTEPKFKDDIRDENSWQEFRKFMKEALSEEKDVRIAQFIQYPLSVVNITESLMSDLYKVFDAGNSYFNVDTVKKDGGEKIQEVLSKIGVVRWISDEGRKCLKNKPNTVVVVDKDEDGKAYLLPIDNDRLIDIKLKEDGISCEYITFLHSIGKDEAGTEEKRISLYDDDNYHVVLLKQGNYTLEKSVPHKIGYCPARMFLTDQLNSLDEFSRKAPLALALAKLQEWQYFDIYKFYTDHYAPFPVTEMMRAKCGNDNCRNGFIYTDETYYVNDEAKVNTTTTKCKVCAEKNQLGVGAKILLDPKEDKDDPDASGKFRMISNSVENLKYLQEKLDSIEAYVKLKVVGIDNILSAEAVNENQVQGSFESRTNVLLSLKGNLDELYVWIVKTVSAVTNGKEVMLNVSGNFGTEWYLVSEDILQERFKSAKDMGMPKEELDMIYKQIIETKYKGNPEKVQRLKWINRLNPCPYEDTDSKIKKNDRGIISDEELIISERIITFVQRFEFENGSIVEFGSELEPKAKYEKIIEQFKTYANEQARKKDDNTE